MRLALPFVVASACVTATQVHAQSIGTTAETVRGNDPEYMGAAAHLGPVALQVGTDVRIEYDSNIFATQDNTVGDAVATYSPYARAEYTSGSVELKMIASAHIRRFADNSNENAEAGSVQAGLAVQPTPNDKFSATASWDRVIEDRGDPEARIDSALGPRIYEILAGILHYRRVGSRLLFDTELTAQKTNALAQIDANRDFTSYAGRATIGYRATGSLFVTASAFVNRRDHRISTSAEGGNRDSTTYGGRLGIEVDSQGRISGNLSAGVFRFEPENPGLPGRTGLSVAGSIIARPTRRNAVIFEVSSGDVATFRLGASSRTDTVARVSLQQEIRHNLLAAVGVGYRRAKFQGSGFVDKTYQANGELEYLVSRSLSVAAGANFAKGTGNDPLHKFERFKGWVELRFSL